MSDPRLIPLVYIAGSSHSGSTLLDLLLGSHSKVESLGEAKKIPQVMQKIRSGDSPVCSCLERIDDCPFWRAALCFDAPYFPERERITFEHGADLAMARRALAFRGREVLLDSSKILGRLGFLTREPAFRLVCVHLIRDPRAVAFSALRKNEKKFGSFSSGGRLRLLMRHAQDWSRLNLKIRNRFGSGKSVEYLPLRYEDFVRDPVMALKKILTCVGLEFESSQMTFRDAVHHNVEGNRLRFQSGCEIRFDSSYLEGLEWKEWLGATMPTLPALHCFGYKFGRINPTS
jgi:hypothetical protein